MAMERGTPAASERRIPRRISRVVVSPCRRRSGASVPRTSATREGGGQKKGRKGEQAAEAFPGSQESDEKKQGKSRLSHREPPRRRSSMLRFIPEKEGESSLDSFVPSGRRTSSILIGGGGEQQDAVGEQKGLFHIVGHHEDVLPKRGLQNRSSPRRVRLVMASRA